MWLTLVLSLPPVAQETDSWLDLFQLAERAQAENDPKDTERWFLAALELDPENPTVAYHLAGTCARAGKVEDAFTWLTRAIGWGWRDDAVMEWDPDLEGLREDPRWSELLATTPAREPEGGGIEIRSRLGLGHPCLSPDGERALTTGRGGAVLWNATDGTVLAFLDEREVSDVQFDLEGTVARTRREDGTWVAWDGRTGERRAELDGEPAVRPEIWGYVLLDGATLLPVRTQRLRAVSAGDIQLLDIADRAVLAKWAAVEGFRSVVYDAESRRLVVELADRVVLVEPGSGRTQCLPGAPSLALAGRPLGASVLGPVLDDHSVLLVVEDGSLRVVDLATGRTRRTIDAQVDGGRARISWSREHAATCDREGVITVWSLRDGSLVARLDARPRSHLALHPSGRAVAVWPWSGGEPGSVLRLDGTSGFDVPGPAGVALMRWSPDGALLASAHADGTVRVWDEATGIPREGAFPHEFPVSVLSFEPGGTRLAVGGESDQAWVWDLSGRSEPRRLALPRDCMGDAGSCGDLAWSPAGELVGTTRCADVRAFGGAELAPLWTYSFGGAVESPLYAVPTVSRQVVFRGMLRCPVLSLANGDLRSDLTDRGLEGIAETGYGALVTEGAWEGDGLVVLDAATFEERYRRIEHAGDNWLAGTPDGWFCGTVQAAEATWAVEGGQPVRLADRARRLYDPKRVRAAAAGVAVLPPRLR